MTPVERTLEYLFPDVVADSRKVNAHRYAWLPMAALVMLVLVVVRCCVSLNRHSGQDKPPRFGDFEAQRHWMELTSNVATREWYIDTPNNDLEYWGLDYPPLTAYLSMLHGYMATFVDPASMALFSSRGYDTTAFKFFMRMTVLSADVVLFVPALVAFVYTYMRDATPIRKWSCVLLLGLQPSLLLVDYGHFQYNCICLALALWSFVFLLNDRPHWAALAFCCAVNYKHMALYFAPAVAAQLFVDAWRLPRWSAFVARLLSLALVVMATMLVIYWPWLPTLGELVERRSIGALADVAARLFPWQRGLFEDKVANVWCTLSPLFRFRERFEIAALRRLCIGATLLASTPALLVTLVRRPTSAAMRARQFVLALSCVSLAFFLFGYHVHEKTLLLPLLPLSLLLCDADANAHALVVVTTLLGHFSILPLSIKDENVAAYVATGALFYLAAGAPTFAFAPLRWLVPIGAAGVVGLHVALLCVPPPPRLPDLYVVLCCSFVASYLALLLLGLSLRLVALRDAPADAKKRQ